jgi:hypothetical protein
VFKHLPIPKDPSCDYLNVKDNNETSITPYTYGELYRNRNEDVRIDLFYSLYPMSEGFYSFQALFGNIFQ